MTSQPEVRPARARRPDPARLHTRGRWPPPDGPRVAIVGSRRPSPYGEAVAEQLAADLARAGGIVVSGLALGCDAAAHRGALGGGGVTIAVIGTGVDIVYPASHFQLAEEILAAGGALVSQFAYGTAPRRHNFPARNQTMAALSDAVVVVEAVQGSGALITAEAALDLHKEVMAGAGGNFSPPFGGTHAPLPGGAGLGPKAPRLAAGRGGGRGGPHDPPRRPCRAACV